MTAGHDEVRDLLGAYALDAVDDVERRAVERLLAEDPGARAEVAGMRAAAAELGASGATAPPARLRESVLAQVAVTPQQRRVPEGRTARPAAPTTAATPSPDGGRTARVHPLRRLTAVAAAAALVAVAVPSGIAWQQHDRAVQAEARAAEVADLLADPGTQLLRGSATDGGDVVAVLGEDSAAILARDLPDVGDRVYQLWAMRDGVPVSAGVLDVRDGSVEALAEGYRAGDGLALSVEPAGGSEQPTTDPVVVLIPG